MGEASDMARRHIDEWKEVADEDSGQQNAMIEEAHLEFEEACDELDPFDRAEFVEQYMATSEALGKGWLASGNHEACPLCGCRRVHASRVGFSIVNAGLGAALFGALGVAAGVIGADDLTMTCLACQYTWRPSG